MEKINRCPMCGYNQYVKYSDNTIMSLEEAFDILYKASLDNATLTAKAELLDEFAQRIREID